MPEPRLRLSDFVTDRVALEPVLLRALRLYISGVEVTQGIQYHRADEHLTDPADHGADNGVTLVARKAAWVRVYLRSLFGIAGVTGTLRLQRRGNSPLWTDVMTISPQPPGAVDPTWSPDYATERGDRRATLNFVIPSAEMIGRMRLIIEVAGGGQTDSFTKDLWITRLQTLRIAGVMVSYNGPSSTAPNAPNVQIAAPTLADLQRTAAFAHTIFPVAAVGNYRNAGTLPLAQPLAGTPPVAGSCTPNWSALVAAVANQRVIDGNQSGWIYYGLVPNGILAAPNGGCSDGMDAAGLVNAGQALAHEAGHACGLAHAPCGNVGTGTLLDSAYPAYEPYGGASIGEYGLDVSTGTILSPASSEDVMSYCGPLWISLRNWERLVDAERLNPVRVGTGLPWWADAREWQEVPRFPRIPNPDPPPFDTFFPLRPPGRPPVDVISLIGIAEEGRMAVRHVARTRMHPEFAGEETAIRARLLDAGGEAIAEGVVLRLALQGGCCGGCKGHGPEVPPRHFTFQALIPDAGAPGARLEIREGDALLWSRDAPSGGPVGISGLHATMDSDGVNLDLRWSLTGRAEEVWLRWSGDGGESWNALAGGVSGDGARVPIAPLTPGRVLIQAVAHDGFFSTPSETVEIEVPGRGPDVAILHPVEGERLAAGDTLRLWGAATGADARVVPADRLLWILDGAEVGQGNELWLTAPERPGEHQVELLARDEHGRSLARVTFQVTEER